MSYSSSCHLRFVACTHREFELTRTRNRQEVGVDSKERNLMTLYHSPTPTLIVWYLFFGEVMK